MHLPYLFVEYKWFNNNILAERCIAHTYLYINIGIGYFWEYHLDEIPVKNSAKFAETHKNSAREL